MVSILGPPDKRILCADNNLYKLSVRWDGPQLRDSTITEDEVTQLVRAIIPLLPQYSSLKLQTKHLLADFSLTAWPLHKKLAFQRRGKLLDAFPKMINLRIRSKKEDDVQNPIRSDVHKTRKRRSDDSSTPDKKLRTSIKAQNSTKGKASTTTKTKAKDNESRKDGGRSERQSNIRVAQSPQWPSIAQLIHAEHCGNVTARSTHANPSTRPAPSMHPAPTALERPPLHILSHKRDKTLIAQDDMEEEMKLRQLTQPASPPRDLQSTSPPRDMDVSSDEDNSHNRSFIGAALDLLFTPVKKLFKQ